MSRQCSSCGAIVRYDASVFCDRCGSRLPAAPPPAALTCRKCGKTQSDRQSRFCDRCGSPLYTPVPAAPPSGPAMKQLACPACGLVNSGELLFFCRKCGSPLTTPPPVTGGGPPQAPLRIPQERGTYAPPEATGAVPLGPAVAPVPAYPAPAGAPAAAQEPPRRRRQEQKKIRGPFPVKKIVAGAAGVVLLLVVVAFFSGSIPGMHDNRTADATAPDATSHGFFESVFSGIIPGQATISNNGTAVVTDTPLAVKTNPALKKTPGK